MLFLRAPAACWCARATVESTETSHSSCAAACASPCNSLSTRFRCRPWPTGPNATRPSARKGNPPAGRATGNRCETSNRSLPRPHDARSSRRPVAASGPAAAVRYGTTSHRSTAHDDSMAITLPPSRHRIRQTRPSRLRARHAAGSREPQGGRESRSRHTSSAATLSPAGTSLRRTSRRSRGIRPPSMSPSVGCTSRGPSRRRLMPVHGCKLPQGTASDARTPCEASQSGPAHTADGESATMADVRVALEPSRFIAEVGFLPGKSAS